MIIYVVVGKYVDYDSSDTWMVKGFTSRKAAESLSFKCREELERLHKEYKRLRDELDEACKKYGDKYWNNPEAQALHGAFWETVNQMKSESDPFLVSSAMTDLSDSTNYVVDELEVE